MRLSEKKTLFIKKHLKIIQEGIEVYLFGSRTIDKAKGGDIDLLLISNKPVEKQKIRKFKIEFYKKFGWQKIDVVSFLKSEEHPFKTIAFQQAIRL